MSWFSRKREKDILQTLLEIESKKAELRGAFELRRLELESENYEAKARVDQEIRQMKSEQRRRARELGLKNASTRPRTKGKFYKEKSDCALCDDPMTRNVSVEMIRAHRFHELGQESPESNLPVDENAPQVPTELGN
jgi:hypothetical protein